MARVIGFSSLEDRRCRTGCHKPGVIDDAALDIDGSPTLPGRFSIPDDAQLMSNNHVVPGEAGLEVTPADVAGRQA
jgi:hypothetical protein